MCVASDHLVAALVSGACTIDCMGGLHQLHKRQAVDSMQHALRYSCAQQIRRTRAFTLATQQCQVARSTRCLVRTDWEPPVMSLRALVCESGVFEESVKQLLA
jgi:hypothetical protein